MLPADPALVDRVRESRRVQGLPPTVEDPTTLAKIAQLLGATNGNAGPRKAGATDYLVSKTATVATTGGGHG